MSTCKSPVEKLRAEAHRAAHYIFANKHKTPRKNEEFLKFAMVMDDGIRTIKIKWADLEAMTLEQIELVVLAAMQSDPTEGGFQGAVISRDEGSTLY